MKRVITIYRNPCDECPDGYEYAVRLPGEDLHDVSWTDSLAGAEDEARACVDQDDAARGWKIVRDWDRSEVAP